MNLGLVAAGFLVVVSGRELDGQAPRYELRTLNGARFAEHLQSEVTAQSGSAERGRVVVRNAQFAMVARGDTLLVTADTVDLHETADGLTRTVDVDAVIGGRWKVILDAGGHADVSVQPFVPGEISDVSDLAIAMDDFFPPAPVTSPRTGAPLRNWARRADSGGVARYHWTAQRHADSSYVAADSVPVRATLDVSEDGDLAWDPARGPVAWTRRVETTAVTRFAGRTNRAIIKQQIVVRRLH
jgi:hypothetical protein